MATKKSKAAPAAAAAAVIAPSNFSNVMIDLETLGTRADSVILSIGAVKFDLQTGTIDDNAFYASISIDSNNEAGARSISEDTLVWWMGQSEEARRVFSEQKTTLAGALDELSDWMGEDDDVKIWSNGADFDIPMMAHAYGTFGLTPPWKFFNARCFRTMKAHFPQAKNVPKPVNKLAHNALQDAITQAQWLIAIDKAVQGRK